MPPKLAMFSEQTSPLSDEVDARLRSLLPSRNSKLGYLPSGPDPQRLWFRLRKKHYARYGLPIEYFGLEEDFDPQRTDELFALDGIHLSGGNTFRFLHWLRVRGYVERLRDYAARGGVLIGVSAGAILMTADIGTSAVCGDARLPEPESDAGLGLVDFGVLPHFDGSPAFVSGLHAHAKQFAGPLYAIPDGAGIIVEGGRTDLIGPVTRETGP